MSFFYSIEETKDRWGEKDTKVRVHVGRIVATAIIAFALFICILGSFAIIPSGNTGVRTTFGQIDEKVVSHGFTWKIPLVQHIQKVNNKQQEITFKEKIWGESSERTVVYMDNVVVTYKINAEYSAWLYANVTDYKQNAIPQTLTASAMKSAMVSLEDAKVTNRSYIEPAAVEKLQAAIDAKYGGNRVITIVNVNVNDMDFEPEYNAAIAAKSKAQLAYQTQQVQNKTAIEAANAEAEKKRIAAKAEADQRVIAAQAEADAILAVAEAQAESNKKLSQSITPSLIDYEKIKSWNGELPTVTGSNAFVGFGIDGIE